jgi:hypothetical protein
MSRSTSPTTEAPSIGHSCFLAARRGNQRPVTLPPGRTRTSNPGQPARKRQHIPLNLVLNSRRRFESDSDVLVTVNGHRFR